MATTTTKTISAALKLIDAKKDNLFKAFEDLQAHSSSLSSFNLSWSDIDSHFTSIQSSLTHKFNLLQSHQQKTLIDPSQPSTSKSQFESNRTEEKKPIFQPKIVVGTPNLSSESKSVLVAGNETALLNFAVSAVAYSTLGKESLSKSAPVASTTSEDESVRVELKSFCERMDGKGLMKYLLQRPKQRASIQAAMKDALRCAPDAAELVLMAMEGSDSVKQKPMLKRDSSVVCVMRINVMLLEEFMGVVEKDGIKSEVKEKAKKMAAEWIKSMSKDERETFKALAILYILSRYDLVNEFDMEDVLDLFSRAAVSRHVTDLCGEIGFVDKVPDVVQKLIRTGKQLLAVKFIFEFQLTDKFPPVPLLQAHVKEANKRAQKVLKEGSFSLRARNEAIAKEEGALKSVQKYIEDYNLGSEYPLEILKKRMEELETQKEECKIQKKECRAKRPAATQPKPHLQSGDKRARTNAPATPAGVNTDVFNVNSTGPSLQSSHLQTAGLLPDQPAPYVGSSAGHYSVAGSTPPFGQNPVSSAGLYGVAESSMGISGNLSPIRSHLYHTESHMPAAYYNSTESHMPAAYHNSTESHMPASYHNSTESHMPTAYHNSTESHMPPAYYSSTESHMPPAYYSSTESHKPPAYQNSTEQQMQPPYYSSTASHMQPAYYHPTESHLPPTYSNPPVSQMPPAYYNMPTAYGGYSLPPQHHSAYHPQ